MTREVIRLEHVSFNYENVTALEDINLSIYDTDFMGIIGPNGGGKSTFLKILLGLLKPSQGKVYRFAKENVDNQQFIGYVPQHLNFDHSFPIRVWDVVLSGRLGRRGLFKRYGYKDKEKAIEALKKVDLFNLRERQIGQLSGGQMQRVLIARALVSDPEVLLLDEPTASIDSQNELNLYEILKSLNHEIPIVIVSHDMGVISSYVNKIACLNRKLYYHNSDEITHDMLEATYNCPVDLIAHGIPHRVLQTH